MPKWHQITLTGIELNGLWLAATTKDGRPRAHSSFNDDSMLYDAAVRALDKLYRSQHGLKMKPGPPPAKGYTANGPPISCGKYDPTKRR